MADEQTAPHATITAAHTQMETLHIILFFPAHVPREHDPHYKVFHETRERLKRLGRLVCWVGNADCSGEIELHHNLIEDALINDVDRIKFALDHPEFTTENDDEFLDLVQGEGNLLPLCVYHHLGAGGIHCLPYPCWYIQKYMLPNLPAPARAVHVETSHSGGRSPDEGS